MRVQVSRATLPSATRGASMVEVLVSVVVLSVGILGNTALYFATMKTKTQVYSRSQAANLAADMAERIRANPLGGGHYAVATPRPVPAPDCVSGCTPADIATADLFQWSQAIDATLRDATRRIDVDTSAEPHTYTITLTWRSSKSGGTRQQYSLVTRL